MRIAFLILFGLFCFFGGALAQAQVQAPIKSQLQAHSISLLEDRAANVPEIFITEADATLLVWPPAGGAGKWRMLWLNDSLQKLWDGQYDIPAGFNLSLSCYDSANSGVFCLFAQADRPARLLLLYLNSKSSLADSRFVTLPFDAEISQVYFTTGGLYLLGNYKRAEVGFFLPFNTNRPQILQALGQKQNEVIATYTVGDTALCSILRTGPAPRPVYRRLLFGDGAVIADSVLSSFSRNFSPFQYYPSGGGKGGFGVYGSARSPYPQGIFLAQNGSPRLFPFQRSEAFYDYLSARKKAVFVKKYGKQPGQSIARRMTHHATLLGDGKQVLLSEHYTRYNLNNSFGPFANPAIGPAREGYSFNAVTLSIVAEKDTAPEISSFPLPTIISASLGPNVFFLPDSGLICLQGGKLLMRTRRLDDEWKPLELNDLGKQMQALEFNYIVGERQALYFFATEKYKPNIFHLFKVKF